MIIISVIPSEATEVCVEIGGELKDRVINWVQGGETSLHRQQSGELGLKGWMRFCRWTDGVGRHTG